MKKIVSFMLIACLALCFATTSFAEAKTVNVETSNTAHRSTEINFFIQKLLNKLFIFYIIGGLFG